MGTFSLFVETTVRDVNGLLELHKVHPQVRADVRRRLGILVDKSYDDMTALEPGYEESSEQICRAISADIIKRTLDVAIPEAQLQSAEKSAACLQQQVHDLETQVEEERICFESLECLFDDLHKGHNFMLHTYFREVLILRHRIRDLENRGRKRSKLMSPPVGSTANLRAPQQPRDSHTGQVLGDILNEITQDSLGEDQELKSRQTSPVVQKDGTGADDPFSPTTEENSISQLKDRKVPKIAQRKERLRSDDPVEAVFDYEKYCDQLHSSALALQERLDQIRDERTAIKQRFQRQKAAWTSRSKYANEPNEQAIKRLEADLEVERKKSNRLQWCLQLAIKPIKLQLMEQLQTIRDEFNGLAGVYRTNISMLQSVIALLEDRVKSLVDFFVSYISDVSTITGNMKKTTNAKNRAELFVRPPQKVEALENFLRASNKANIIPSENIKTIRDGLVNTMIAPDVNLKEGFGYWSTHPFASDANKSLEELMKFSDKLRSRRTFAGTDSGENSASFTKTGARAKDRLSVSWAKSDKDALGGVDGGVGGGDVTGDGGSAIGDISGNSSHTQQAGASAANAAMAYYNEAWRKTAVDGAGMSGEELLQELIRLRMQRVADRARLKKAQKSPLSTDSKLNEKISALHQNRIDRNTKRIDELVALLTAHQRRIGENCFGAAQQHTSATKTAGKQGTTQDYYTDAAAAGFSRGEGEEDEDSESAAAMERRRQQALLQSPYLHNFSNCAPNSDGVFVVPMESPNPESQFVVFKNDLVPISSFLGDSNLPIEEPEEEIVRGRGLYCTPTSAVMAYCRGVHMGLPMGNRYGPVFIVQDEESSTYYVGDETGNNLLRDAVDRTYNGDWRGYAAGGERPMIPMTQLIYPVPASLMPGGADANAGVSNIIHAGSYYYYGTADDSLEAASPEMVPSSNRAMATANLQPVHLIPLTTPISGTGRIFTGMGHTADSELFAPYIPVPLSHSYRHVLGASPTSSRAANPYALVPPRVCRPPTEEQSMFRIQGIFTPSSSRASAAAAAAAGASKLDSTTPPPTCSTPPPPPMTTATGPPSPRGEPATISIATALRQVKEQRTARALAGTTGGGGGGASMTEAPSPPSADQLPPASKTAPSSEPAKYLSLRLPRLMPKGPSPQQTAQLQQQLKPSRTPAPPVAGPANGGESAPPQLPLGKHHSWTARQ